jgi:imidazolonepropionase-like amidohydrolase
MPGLIDAHVHLMFATLFQAAGDMLLRGFISVRDLGGPTFGLKQAIEAGVRCIDHGQLLGEPPQAARDVQRHGHRLRARQEARHPHRLGQRHSGRRCRPRTGGDERAVRKPCMEVASVSAPLPLVLKD